MSKIEELEAEIITLRTRLKEAAEELLLERFADTPARYAEGDIVLVPRNLFGEIKHWPAQIAHVHRSYNAGTYNTGETYETKIISYTVFFLQKDGTFGGTSSGFYEHQIQPSRNDVASVTP